MADRYGDHASNLISPASGGFPIAPGDQTVLGEVTRAIYVGAGGDLVVELVWGGTVTFKDVQTGTLLPIRARRVLAASTAQFLVGLY